ncbi:MAG TPA: hypothetical protein VFX49_05565, partial [Chloroflexota bacterium]|nr:hypothetical protein [Chloroflexota bacterium]
GGPPPRLARPLVGTALTRRALLLSSAAVGAAGCAVPWQPRDPRAPIYVPPVTTPVRFGPTWLRLVLSQEGQPALDAAVRDAVTQAARSLDYKVDLFDLQNLVGPAGESSPGAIARRLLVTVQAGLPPDGVLLLGRQAQTARLQGMGLLQDVSGLMRTAKARAGALPEAIERQHFLRGTWFAAPLYQRLTGHRVRADVFARAGLDPETATATLGDLRASIDRLGMGWGVAPEDTADADAWCWGVIHAFGGALADRSGERVTLASPQTAAALEWLVAAFRALPGARGDAPYVYTEGSPPAGASLVSGPAGPAQRPRAVGGGAVWVLPRGAPPDPVERLWEALLQPDVQRRLWGAGAGFALPVFEGQWSDPAVAALPDQESVRRYRALLAPGGFISHAGQAGDPTPAAQVVEAARLGVRMVRAALGGRPIAEVLAAALGDAEAIYREHAFPEG